MGKVKDLGDGVLKANPSPKELGRDMGRARKIDTDGAKANMTLNKIMIHTYPDTLC